VEVALINASVLALPASARAGVIVYDGTEDLGLWRPPGPDRDFQDAYGDTLTSLLAKERAQLPGGRLPRGQALRIHPGKLRCDFLIWVASRPPHGDEQPAPAPDLAAIEQLSQAALRLAEKHDAERVAFGALGAGPGAADAAERMAAVVRGARAYEAECLRRGAAPPLEEVLVCAPNAADVAKAKRLTSTLAKQVTPAPTPRFDRSDPPPRAPARKPSTPRRAKGKLDPEQLAMARSHAGTYDRTQTYATGDWLMHPSFGAGQVQSVATAERMITVLFGDGQERRLIHQRG
jgi:O-acetyl-ADP-ribose deacetylase (regulator of RNase III)